MSHTVRPPGVRRGFAVLAFVSLLLGSAAPVDPPTGTIEGHVRDQSGAPVANAQVVVVGTPLNVLADTAGAYRLTNVPAGEHTVRAAFIGFRATAVMKVLVRRGKVTRLDITVEQSTVETEEITVVTQAQPLAPRDEAASTAAPPSIDGAPADPGQYRSPPLVLQPGILPPAGPTAGMGALGAVGGGNALATPSDPQTWNTENYAATTESRFLAAASNPRSTFSIDVDAASYTNVRRFLTAGQRPPKDAVRIEEFLNYFRYDYPEPRKGKQFSVTTDVGVAPWAPEHRLVRIGIKGRALDTRTAPPSNLVFLIDVSGSMRPENKLPLVKQAFRMLTQQLRSQDRVAIVVYAGAAGLVLPSTAGTDKETILAAIDRLEAGGSTAGGAGLRLAYETARQYYAPDRNNRVILATDGDFNVGESSDAAMVQLIEERRDQGVFLTVVGVGTGNLKDSRMEQIADKGNGHYAYLDNLKEAERVFVREFAGTLVTIAKDVKIQVEFNPAKVVAYRLVGYENRALRNEDFADDRKDAGELGAGHTVTAMYEVVPAGASLAGTADDLDSLKYQQVSLRPAAARSDEWLTVQLRYKEPTGTKSRLITHPVKVRDRVGEPTGDFRFATAVAGFGLVLRDSEYRGLADLNQVLQLANGALGEDEDGERAEFVRLVESARGLYGPMQEAARVGEDE